MKRYWKLISIIVVVIVTIGTYYVQSAVADNAYPAFGFEHKSGDKEEINDLTLDANYREGTQGDNPLQITADETVYHDEQSYFDRLNDFYPTKIKELQEEYRGFMRGKGATPSQFYENGSMLIYANVDSTSSGNHAFELEIMQKESSETTAFKLDVPASDNIQSISIEAIQVMNHEVKVMTRNFSGMDPTGFNTQEDMHVYDVDVANQKITNDEVISPNLEQNNADSANGTIINNATDEDSKAFMLINFDYMENSQQEDGISYSEQTGKEIIAFNLETNETEQLDLPAELENSAHTAVLHDSTIYFSAITDTDVEVSAFSMDSQEIERNIQMDQLEAEAGQPHMQIKDNKMYLVSSHKDNDVQAAILVVDLDTGDTLYEGTIEQQGNEQVAYDMDISNVSIE
ncbi:hypothetical protein KFZ56_03585 [Virgibacillus sp. NKC19-3]|uniref:hypothetical protein n=1 Tax=Virgibacillus saliphilus TaxID=2831674 RepID=UPI001C9B4A92|nr:hypothetical protein [Virgibacillus sp. NKC19-3]MBY7142187.1 hypothetical protein [Virgibacillus sp. NKC19-3]